CGDRPRVRQPLRRIRRPVAGVRRARTAADVGPAVTLCLVTDRARLGQTRTLVDQARDAVAAGIDLIQIRERDLDAGPLAALVDQVMRVARGSSTRVVVNDRLDVALACGADGVHLRGDSISIAAARRITPPRFLVGKSVHSVDEARAAIGADYLVAGSV